MDLPSFVQIEPVGQCNLRCRMCPIQFRRDGPPYGPLAFIDFDLYTRLVDSFPNLSELQLQGMGEPMMHPRFFDMVAYAAGKDIEVSTNSNLTLLSERRARLCVSSGLGYLHVSLDGASAETYEAIRVRAQFDRVLRNLRRLIEARRQAASELPRIRLVAVAMRTNLHELPALVHLAHEHGIAVLRALQLGDLLCAIPALRALRSALPQAEITLVGLPWAQTLRQRFAHIIDDLIALPGYPGLPEMPADRRAIPKFLAEMRRREFDLAIQLHGSGEITNPLLALFGARVN